MKNVFKSSTAKQREYLYLLLCVILYVVITSFFDITCIIKYFSGVSCPGCGMTRALKSLLVFNFDKAFYYHPLVFLLAPLTIALFTVRKNHKIRNILIYIAIAMFILVYLYRLIFTHTDIVTINPKSGLIAKFFIWLF